MNKRQTRIATGALLALGAVGSPILFSHLDTAKLRSGIAAAPSIQIVPVELVLLVDTSGSVDDDEYDLQKLGYEQAFRNPDLAAAIEAQGGIVATYIEWSYADYQDVRIDWTHLKTADDCWTFANEIGSITRQSGGETMLAPALQFATDKLETNEYYGMKRVIDVSGDGRGENYDYYLSNTDFSAYHGQPWNDVMSSISSTVSQINGICITTDADVVDFYTNVLPHGPDAFMMQVNDFAEFENAILEKLVREITGVPGLFD